MLRREKMNGSSTVQRRITRRNGAGRAAAFVLLGMVLSGGCSNLNQETARYTLSFDTQGGGERAAVVAAELTPIERPADPSKNDFVFRGWYTGTDEQAALYVWPHILVQDVLMYAHWRAISTPEPLMYTLSFDSRGGSALDALKAEAESLVSKPADPQRKGFVFTGWFTKPSGGARYTWPLEMKADRTVYAQWREDAPSGAPASYSISFDTQGGYAAAADSAEDGTPLAQPADPRKKGFVFTGWFTKPSGGARYTWPLELKADVTAYAQWRDENLPTPASYTLSFDSQGGGAVEPASAPDGTLLAQPADPRRDGFVFDGWFSDPEGGKRYTWPVALTKDLVVYAHWISTLMPRDLSLAQSLAWIAENAQEGGEYTILVRGPEDLAPQTLSYNGKAVGVILDGGAGEKQIGLNASGALFTVDNKTSLTLSRNITLRGRVGNTEALVKVNEGGTLIMEENAKIAGNKAAERGGAVYVEGVFTMKNGELADNAGYNGGAVYVYGGSFSMEHGTITRNTATAYGGAVFVDHIRKAENDYRGSFTMENGKIIDNKADRAAGAVYVSYGAFTLKNGEIRENRLTGSSPIGGGGVYVAAGTFTLEGGTIAENQGGQGSGVYLTHEKARFIMNGGAIADHLSGGGVYMGGGTFTMNSGEISGNTSSSQGSQGGGVYMADGTFTLSGGTIARNTSSYGGGVYVNNGTFTMNNGEITQNIASQSGGGVYMYNGTFTMRGGAAVTGNTGGEWDVVGGTVNDER
jgi:uncharacterized repeat protein (TIGR02543 family)